MNIRPAAIRIPANEGARPALVDVFPPFRERIAAFKEMAAKDPDKAAEIFAEAQALAKAFWAGVDFACGVQE